MTGRSTMPRPAGGATTAPAPPLDAADIFNGYVGSCVMYALQDLGLVSELREGPVDLAAFAARSGARIEPLRAMVRTAERLGHMALAGERCALTADGERLCESICYFTGTVGGYGELFLEMAALTRGEKALGTDVPMRFDQVAKGRQQYSRRHEREALDRALEGVEPRVILDLASGDGSFLLYACARYPWARGFGVDVDPAACAKARARVEAAGLGGRVAIVEGSIASVLERPALTAGLADAELVTNFALLHHLIGTPAGAVGFLRGLLGALPRARHLLFSDITAMPEDQRGRDVPVFSLAYELFHVFMGIEIQPHEAYLRVFSEAGLHVVRHLGFGQPNDQLYLLAPDG